MAKRSLLSRCPSYIRVNSVYIFHNGTPCIANNLGTVRRALHLQSSVYSLAMFGSLIFHRGTRDLTTTKVEKGTTKTLVSSVTTKVTTTKFLISVITVLIKIMSFYFLILTKTEILESRGGKNISKNSQ